jgi:hypothetical protein
MAMIPDKPGMTMAVDPTARPVRAPVGGRIAGTVVSRREPGRGRGREAPVQSHRGRRVVGAGPTTVLGAAPSGPDPRRWLASEGGPARIRQTQGTHTIIE